MKMPDLTQPDYRAEDRHIARKLVTDEQRQCSWCEMHPPTDYNDVLILRGDEHIQISAQFEVFDLHKKCVSHFVRELLEAAS